MTKSGALAPIHLVASTNLINQMGRPRLEAALHQTAAEGNSIGGLAKLEVERDHECHLALRRERSGPVVAELRSWMTAQGGLRRSEFGKAVAYALSHWDGLVRFLDDALVPLDNNRAERALRGLVLGRKNHYGSRSQRGANVSALFYSLIGTAKLNGLDPETYLREALTAALKTPGAATLPFSA